MADSIDVIVARIDERLSALKVSIDQNVRAENQDLDEIRRSVDALGTRIKVIEDMATRYRGGFITVLTFGGFVGWIASNIDFLKNTVFWFRG